MPPARPVNTHAIRRASSFCNAFDFTSLSRASQLPQFTPPVTGDLSPDARQFSHRSGGGTFARNMAIRGLLEAEDPKGAFLEYGLMRREGVGADSHTVGFAVKGCCAMRGVWEGRQVHCHALTMGFDSEVVVQTVLLEMYALFGELQLARRIFDETSGRDVPMWNAIVTVYAQMGWPEEAVRVAHAMRQGGVRPNQLTCMSVLSACSSLKDWKCGKSVHAYAVKNVLHFDVLLCGALVNMYAKCGCLQSARRLFDMIRSRDVVPWTTLINGYSDNNCPGEALALFEEMVAAEVVPDEVTMLSVASMCGELRRKGLSEFIEEYIQEKGFGGSTHIANALMHMHAKCGNIRKACRIFEEMKVRTIVSWTTIIQGLAICRRGVEALVRFSQMQRIGYRPDGLCFLSILSACNHSELVEEGTRCFRSMTEEHQLTPWLEHYGTMVDLLCKAGLVNEAFELLESMPMEADARMRCTFVRACEDKGNFILAARALGHWSGREPAAHCGDRSSSPNALATIGEWNSANEPVEMENKVCNSDFTCISLIEANA